MDQQEYRLEIKVRNNLLLSAIEKAGYKNPTQFARQNNLNPTHITEICSMRDSPLTKGGQIKPIIETVMTILCCSLEDLFTSDQLFGFDKTSYSYNISKEQMGNLLGYEEQTPLLADEFEHERLINGIRENLNILTERQRKVILMRFGIEPYDREYSLEEIGKLYDITGSRVRQIEAKALRRLRKPEIMNPCVKEKGREGWGHEYLSKDDKFL